MSIKSLFISALGLVLALTITAAPQVEDAPGVAVNLNGTALLHRSSIAYPMDAVAKGIQGTVVVQVKLNGDGEVSDATVVSGPEELHRAVVQSVLSWHFAKDAANSTRTVSVEFTAAQARPAPMPPAPPSGMAVAPVQRTGPPLTVKDIEIQGLSEQARAELMGRLAIHTGDTFTSEQRLDLTRTLHDFDSHLSLSWSANAEGLATVRIAPAGTMPQRIRVGGNVQSAMLVQQQRPEYPADAKAAGVQGTVRLNVVIGSDGHVQDISVVEGDATLAAAALKAVSQWVYKPTLLNGNPVQVQTTVDVNFTLAK